MRTHTLKTWPEYFARIASGAKRFEIRANDRDYQTGDQLILQEYNPKEKAYVGNCITATVSYIIHGGQFGLDSDYVVMSLSNLAIWCGYNNPLDNAEGMPIK